MKTLPSAQLQRLIDSWPHLTRERRAFLVDYLVDSGDDSETILEIFETFPPEDQAFIKACCGINDQPPIRKAA